MCNTLQRVGGILFLATVLISSLLLLRWFYYMSAITCGSSIVLLALFYFPPNYQQLHTLTPKREQFKKIDFVGLVLFSGGILLFMLGLCKSSELTMYHFSDNPSSLGWIVISLGVWPWTWAYHCWSWRHYCICSLW